VDGKIVLAKEKLVAWLREVLVESFVELVQYPFELEGVFIAEKTLHRHLTFG